MEKVFYRYMVIGLALTNFFINSNMANAGELIKGRYIKESPLQNPANPHEC